MTTNPSLAALVDEEVKRCLDQAAEGLHWFGPDGTILWANQTELDLLRYAHDECIGHHIGEFHVDKDVIDDIMARLGRGETLLSYEARLRHRDGSIRHVQINSNVRWHGDTFLHTAASRAISPIKGCPTNSRCAWRASSSTPTMRS